MGSTIINSYTYPEGTDQPTTPADMRRSLEEVARGGVMRFASSAARTAAFTTLGISPSEGMVSYLTDSDSLELYDGTAWVPAGSPASWTDFSSSFVIGASVTPPTKGSSVYTASYSRQFKTCDYTFEITIGAGFAAGSGDYRFLLPIPAVVGSAVGLVRILDAGTAYYVAALYVQSANQLECIRDGASTIIGSAGPGTAWATGDAIRGSIRYPIA